MNSRFILKGDICYSKSPDSLATVKNGYAVCENGLSLGVYSSLPSQYSGWEIIDYGNSLIIPGLTDLHTHAPQYSFCALGMDLELLDWLNTHTFPEEAKFSQLEYAKKSYSAFVKDLSQTPNTRACIFATIHSPATIMLMDMLEQSGHVTMVGKVNMDRNSPDILRETSAKASAEDTEQWITSVAGKYKNTYPIITPRFIPSCTDELMQELSRIQQKHGLAVQSHLSENKREIEWVKELCPHTSGYSDAYLSFGMFGGGVPTIMAHCVWMSDEEIQLMQQRNVYVAHCPQSNTNLASGIAPIRRFLDAGVPVALGSDVAGGSHLSIFRAISDAVQVSKLHWRLTDSTAKPLTLEEAFYIATIGGGSFFGKVGSFEAGYEFDAVIIDDASLAPPYEISIQDRLAKVIYLSDSRNIQSKFARGVKIL